MLGDRTLKESRRLRPREYELETCGGEGAGDCSHPEGYHKFMRELEEIKRKK
jgi:hypothetical protein